MSIRSGTASLPLHYGKVPGWLSHRMATLGAAIAEAVIIYEGRNAFLRRLSDPFWFQSFGAVLGMDWHSSGITTSVMGALKRGLQSKANELGIHVLGGRGRHSRKTPDELMQVADKRGLDGDHLTRTSRLVAKVDNTAVQDGFQLYLHSFVVTDTGEWVVVQQGMNGSSRQARRYHWRSESVSSFVDAPHDAMVGANQGIIVNLTDRRAAKARDAAVTLAAEGPDQVAREFVSALKTRCLVMPSHHEVRATDLFLRRLHGVMALTKERGVEGFEDLLLIKGLGPRTLQALALVAEVAFGAPSRFDDPARFAFAHGGKDGHPHPVPLKIYDRTISTLRSALEKAAIGENDKIDAFKRLDQQTRRLERQVDGPSFNEIVDRENRLSGEFDGMTVFGSAKKATPPKVDDGAHDSAPMPQGRQLRLPI
jgi:uncharacterized protein